MNLAAISAVRAEIESVLSDKRFGKVFTLSRYQIAVDFRLPDSRYLFISTEPASPRIYLITRRLRDLEKEAVNANSFAVFIQKRLAGMRLASVKQIENERVLSLNLFGSDDFGADKSFSLTSQLTGRSANLFLLDANKRILESLRETAGPGQQSGDIYSPPHKPTAERARQGEDELLKIGGSVSEELDEFYLAAAHESRVRSLTSSARTKLAKKISKLERLAGKLDADLAGHGDAERWKRFGDLLLANAAAARRDGDSFVVVDYYDESLPEIAVKADENDSLTETAEKYFKRYTKSRNAAVEIALRREALDKEMRQLRSDEQRLEAAIADGDETLINEFSSDKKPEIAQKVRAATDTNSFARSFISTDGFEILVGKKAKDNDHLSFRIAKSLDTWMHAADYPGSHVVIRNPNRKEMPPKTLLEAAQLAAFYSQGRAQTKAAVHYTQKKFVNKPRGSAPGLVSLASFKTILVEPKVPDLTQN